MNEDIFALQMAYARAAFEAERWKTAAEMLKQRLDAAARAAAKDDCEPDVSGSEA